MGGRRVREGLLGVGKGVGEEVIGVLSRFFLLLLLLLLLVPVPPRGLWGCDRLAAP